MLENKDSERLLVMLGWRASGGISDKCELLVQSIDNAEALK
jgi:hypothetical protein